MSLDREVKLIWLGRYRRIYLRISDMQNEIETLTEVKVPIITGLPGAQSRSNLDGILIRQEEILKDCCEAYKELQSVRREIVAAIDKIPDETAARVMYLRHIGLLSWQEIADEVHYTLRSVRRYHRIGLDSLII